MDATSLPCFESPSGSLGMLDQDGTSPASDLESPDTELSSYSSICGSTASGVDSPQSRGPGGQALSSMDYVTGVRTGLSFLGRIGTPVLH
jgi:hypothetical protein